MTTVGVVQAKARFGQLLKLVSKGETIRITRRGIPVADLIPSGYRKSKDLKRFVREIREIRKGATLGGLKIRNLIAEGRRY